MGKIKKTKSVMLLLESFGEDNDALALADLIDRFEDKMNKTTVYRILQRLDERGILHSFTGKDGRRWYAKCQENSSEPHLDKHPHFQCKACGKVECLTLDITIPSIPDYKIDSAQLLLIGKCKDCLP